MHYNCLIVDDETELAEMTSEYFRMFEVSCVCAASAAECEQFLQEHETDVILLDINLQGESGFLLCKKIREQSNIPILFISARQSDDDVLIALNIGGDDYIKKPYSLSVLLAKVKIILKRSQQWNCRQQTGEDIQSPQPDKQLKLEEEAWTAEYRGRRVSLKAREFRLLQCLYENKNRIMTKEQLFNEVWGDSFYSDGTLNVHIRRLREKLEENPNEPVLIRTVWGTGYILEL